MIFKLSCLFLLLTTSIVASSKLRIVNGDDAKLGEAPYMVSIRYWGQHLCGGMLLDEEHILTAAHCVHRKSITYMRIVAGTIKNEDIINDEFGNEVSYWTMHEYYENKRGLANDIAVIRMAENFKLGPNIQPVLLPPKNWETIGGSDVIVYGWGSQELGGDAQDTLKKVTLKAMTWAECTEIYSPKEVKDSVHQCAGNRPGYAHCQGDSGGPLVDAQNKYLVGIVSWSLKPCGKFPGVYTKVVNYLDWIEENRRN